MSFLADHLSPKRIESYVLFERQWRQARHRRRTPGPSYETQLSKSSRYRERESKRGDYPHKRGSGQRGMDLATASTYACPFTHDMSLASFPLGGPQGQYYLVTHPKLLKPVLLALITSTAFTVCVTIALFVFTYLPTVAVLAFFNGPLAFLTAVLVIKAEAAAIAITVSKIFWLRGAQDRLFDEVSR